MSMVDRIPAMSDADLASLHATAQRLETEGTTPGQKAAAAEMLPVIAAELAQRLAAKPKPAAKARKTAAKKTSSKKTASDAAVEA